MGGVLETDYSPHHEPFEYYASTANPMHRRLARWPWSATVTRPTTSTTSPTSGLPRTAATCRRSPYLKAPRYQDGHGSNSDPLDEQTWLVNTINQLESLPTWRSTAVVVTWDDSDGWYDNILGPIETQSQTSVDALTDPNLCGSEPRRSRRPPLASPNRVSAVSARDFRSW